MDSRHRIGLEFAFYMGNAAVCMYVRVFLDIIIAANHFYKFRGPCMSRWGNDGWGLPEAGIALEVI